MANPTTNFGWVMPTSTSLVTNLPADFNTFGQAVDTSMSELLGGTTGQVLSKTSNTNMDFTWVTPTDQTPLTTKGDLFTFTTVDARLGVGTNGQVLTADSTAATGLKWATAAAGGKVLQVVTATYATSTSNSSATYADTGLSATITPTLNTSKVLVLVYHNGITKTAAVNYQQMSIKLVRASTDILVSSGIDYTAVANDASTTFAASILDSPATTSATTYKTTFNSAGVASVTVQNGGSTSTITLLEIGA